jgi:protein-L-isoaspartate O-methyltransferase
MRGWRHRGQILAAAVTHPLSRWWPVIATIPRHVFVPRWFEPGDGVWVVRDGSGHRREWADVAYGDRTAVTRVGAWHADHVEPGTIVSGRPTSSATLPSLLLQMYRHAMFGDGLDILDAGTGSGYGACLLAARFGDRVLSGDVDPYLVEAAASRCRAAGVVVRAEAFDVTGRLREEFDRIIATFSVPHVPASWVSALRSGGRVVLTLTDTGLILVLDKADDGTLRGSTAWDRAGFMAARYHDGGGRDGGEGRDGDEGRELALTGAGDTRWSVLPVVDVAQGWPLWSTFNLENPGVRHDFTDGGGVRRALMWADDGSWARAESLDGGNPEITQGGPRRLWDALDAVRERMLAEGDLPCYGARVRVEPDGTTTVWRGRGAWAWKVVREPCPPSGEAMAR